MSKELSIAELRKMTQEDLQKEISAQRRLITKINMGIVHGKEKNTHKLNAAKKTLARMLTVANQLRDAEQASSIAAPK